MMDVWSLLLSILETDFSFNFLGQKLGNYFKIAFICFVTITSASIFYAAGLNDVANYFVFENTPITVKI